MSTYISDYGSDYIKSSLLFFFSPLLLFSDASHILSTKYSDRIRKIVAE